jgi:hypothetical protein
MELSDVAKRFDTEIFQSYFDNTETFNGQMRPFTQSTRSGPTTPRRVLSVAPDVSMPARRIVKMISSGQVFVVGIQNEDYFGDAVIRKEYPVIPVSSQAEIGSVGAHLADSGLSSDVFVFSTYVRRVPLEEESSIFFAGYEFYFSSTDTISNDSVIKLGTDYYRVKVPSSTDGAGFGMCEAIRLDSPMTTVTYTKKDAPYDPATDSYAPTVISGVPAFVEPLQFNFQFSYPSFNKVDAGDRAISVLKTSIAVATPGDTVATSTDTRKVVSVRDGGTAWILHCR